MKPMEVGLRQEVPSEWQWYWILHRQLLELGKPLPLGPEGSDESHFRVDRAPELVDGTSNETEGGKGIHLKIVPILQKGVDSCCRRIPNWSEINWKSVVQ